MRVIAGSHRGRRLSGPQRTTLRPTSDKVREALFSILGSRVPGSRFLDLYAGTGAVGIEALSRGAISTTFVESRPQTVRLIEKNLQACALAHQAVVRTGRVDLFLNRTDWWDGPYDIVFADPPYAAGDELTVLSHLWKPGLFAEEAVMVIEQEARQESPASIDHGRLIRRYEYGDTALGLYQVSSVGKSKS